MKFGGWQNENAHPGVSIDVLLLSQVMYTGESDPTASQLPSKPVRDWILGCARNEVKQKFPDSVTLVNYRRYCNLLARFNLEHFCESRFKPVWRLPAFSVTARKTWAYLATPTTSQFPPR